VQDDGAGLEQRQFAVLERGHLSKRLQVAVAVGLLVALTEQPHLIGKAGLFERPAHAEVTHRALRERRHRAERTDPDHSASPLLICPFSDDVRPRLNSTMPERHFGSLLHCSDESILAGLK
jgi:hypothetical protein